MTRKDFVLIAATIKALAISPDDRKRVAEPYGRPTPTSSESASWQPVGWPMSRTMNTADYRIRLAQLIAVPAPVTQQPPSICHPDRHRRTDEQITLSTLRYLGTTLVGVAVAIAVAIYAGVR
jgi:hypothetical protein